MLIELIFLTVTSIIGVAWIVYYILFPLIGVVMYSIGFIKKDEMITKKAIIGKLNWKACDYCINYNKKLLKKGCIIDEIEIICVGDCVICSKFMRR